MEISTTLNAINSIIPNLVLLVLSINVVLCFLNRRKLDTSFTYLFYYLIWNLIIEVLAIICIELGWNNLPLLHIYTLGEFVLFSLFYKNLLEKPFIFHTIFPYFLAIGSAFIIANSIFFQSIYAFNTYAKSMVQISIIGYAVLYFYNMMEDKLLAENTSKSLRLINSAIIIYYSGSLFVFMYGFSIDLSETYLLFWAFNAILNLVFQMLILWALWIAYFKKRIF